MISIVIPVYNVAPYLQKCVESVINQSFKNIEIILVDDGSTDQSGLLCDQLSGDDSRIRVIHKENGGLSDARNTGLRVCTGEYVLFLDSDDYWEGDFLSEVAAHIESHNNCDIVFTDGFKKVLPKGTLLDYTLHPDPHAFRTINGKDVLKYLLNFKNSIGKVWSWSVWQNVYKTSFLRSHNLYFKEGILIEDAEWTPRVILKAQSFDFYQKNFYRYRRNPNSIMNVCSAKKLIDYLNTVDQWIAYANSINDLELAQIIRERFSNNYFDFLKYIRFLDPEIQKEIIFRLNQSSFLNYVTDKKFVRDKTRILRNGYDSVLTQLYLAFKAHNVLKNILVKMNIIDR